MNAHTKANLNGINSTTYPSMENISQCTAKGEKLCFDCAYRRFGNLTCALDKVILSSLPPQTYIMWK